MLVIDDEDKIKVVKEKEFHHFDLTPLEINEDYSESDMRLQEESHRLWCSAVEFLMTYDGGDVFQHKDIVYWAQNYRDPYSKIDYDTPMYILSVDNVQRTAQVISMLQPVPIRDTDKFKPLKLDAFSVETVPLYRLRKSYYA